MMVSDLHPREVVSISESESLRGAAKLLVDDDIGALLVVGSLDLGILSERDLARAVADGVDMDDTEVGDYMTTAPVTVDLHGSISEIVDEMNEFSIRHVVVTERNKRLGMVSMRDVVSLMAAEQTQL